MLKPKKVEEMLFAYIEKRRKITGEQLTQNKPIDVNQDDMIVAVIETLCTVHEGFKYDVKAHRLDKIEQKDEYDVEVCGAEVCGADLRIDLSKLSR